MFHTENIKIGGGITLITKISYIPTTNSTRPFASAAEKCDFTEIDYIEDEYFMSGTANIYEESEHQKPKVIISDAPYTTRLLIRRPKEKQKFSGNIVIEILNATAMIDIDRMWVNSWQFFTRNGDIYIGITSKGHVVDSLKKFNSVRYEAINWSNPQPDRIPSKEILDGPFPFLSQYESGLFWDMLIDLAKLLRTDDALNPISDYGKGMLFLTGWSQSGSYLARILHTFAYLQENTVDGPLFDGYLLAGCGATKAPLNAYSPGTALSFFKGGIPQGSILGGKEPVMAINTESENRLAYWYGDFDDPDFKFRTWDIPASSHDTDYNLIEYYEGQGRLDLNKINISNGWEGFEGEPMDCPYEPIFNAAFFHLYNWARYKIPAPHAPKIKTKISINPETGEDPFGSYAENVTDHYGNAVGGIRHPVADCPTGVYTSFSKTATGGVQPMFGSVMPFSQEQLKVLYGTLENYRTLVARSTDNAISLGFILPDDRNELIERVVSMAVNRGLE
jgi:hypothetical protein